MPPQEIDDDVVADDIPLDHEAVLKRFEECTSAEYPFPVPERKKPGDRRERVNLKSKKNLRPLLASLLSFLARAVRPPLTIMFAGLGCFATGLAASIFYALAVICLVPVLLDPFFMHYITDGRVGGLGTGGGNAKPTEGFFCSDTPRNHRIRERLIRFLRYRPTAYLYSGDLLTLAPFLLFKGSKGGRVAYRRFWVRVPSAPAPDGDDGPFKYPSGTDDEAVALDVVFPSGGHQSDKPTFLVLHGLNGGSTEPYVLDLARRATREGHTVAVMVSRGLMKTPVRGMDSFHGARTSDVGCAVDALLYALGGERRGTSSDGGGCGAPKNSRIVLVGFSMGGVVAANYAAKSKERSGLAGALSFSGALCTEKMLLSCSAAAHSLSVWQPALAWGLKGTIVKPNMTNLAKRGITNSEVDEIRTVVDIDTELVCKYHGYPTVHHYYEDMSAGGKGDEKGISRLEGTKVPLLAVHAIDDPISIYEVALSEEIAKTENVMLLATKHGGHIGWPTGIFPSSNRWAFMIDIAMEFASSVAQEK